MQSKETPKEPAQSEVRARKAAARSVAAEFARPPELIGRNRHCLTAPLHKNGPDHAERQVQTALEGIATAVALMNRLRDNILAFCGCLCGTVVPAGKLPGSGGDAAQHLRRPGVCHAIGVHLAAEYGQGAAWSAMAAPVFTGRIPLHLLSNGLRARSQCRAAGAPALRLQIVL